MDKKQFFTDTLKALGITPNENNLAFLLRWSDYEKRKAGAPHGYNPLNTTKKVTGSTNMKGSVNAGYPVQDYPSHAIGVQATALTLKLPYYAYIIKALKGGKPLKDIYNSQDSTNIANNIKTWGTHNFAANFKPLPPKQDTQMIFYAFFLR